MINVKEHRIFAFCALLFGLIFIFLLPPSQISDEDSHFKKAYSLAEGQIFPEVVNNKAVHTFPKNLLEYIDNYTNSFASQLDVKSSFSKQYLEDRLNMPSPETVQASYSAVSFHPVAHIVPTIGILIGKFFGLKNTISITSLLFFARLANLLFYIFIVALAIKITPCYKKTFTLIGLIPQALFLASSPSYDALLISTVLLFFALVFNLLFNENAFLSYKYIIAFSLIGIVLLNVKMVYFTVFIFLFCIPVSKYKNIKKMLLSIGIVVLVSGFSYLIYNIPYSLITSSIVNPDSHLISGQLNYVLSNPFKFISATAHTSYHYLEYYAFSTVGIFGNLDTNMPSFVYYFYLMGAFIFAFVDISSHKIKFSIVSKICSAFAFLLSFFGIFLALYISWTSILPGLGVGSPMISGVQGRYFIPLLLLALIPFANSFLTRHEKIHNISQSVMSYQLFLIVPTLTLSVLTILLRFWI